MGKQYAVAATTLLVEGTCETRLTTKVVWICEDKAEQDVHELDVK